MSKSKLDDDGEGLVLEYMLEKNRPYSMSDIAQNLHNELGKTSVQRMLDKLTQDGKIIEKSYGKQKIYFIDQSSLNEASPNEIKEMDIQIEEAEKLLKEQERCVKAAEAENRKLMGTLTSEELQKTVLTLRTEVEQLKDKLKSLKETTVVVDKAERQLSRKHRNRCVQEWRNRKNKCMEVLGGILENYPKPAKELLEEIGIITDEAAGVKIPILKG